MHCFCQSFGSLPTYLLPLCSPLSLLKAGQGARSAANSSAKAPALCATHQTLCCPQNSNSRANFSILNCRPCFWYHAMDLSRRSLMICFMCLLSHFFLEVFVKKHLNFSILKTAHFLGYSVSGKPCSNYLTFFLTNFTQNLDLTYQFSG